MTPTFCCGFECGILGSSSVGQHWVDGNNNLSISTSIVRNGSRSLRVNLSAANSQLTCGYVPSGSVVVGRFYVYFTSLPNVNLNLFRVMNGLTGLGGVLFNTTGNVIHPLIVSGNTPAGVAVTTGRWYRIDFKIDVTNNPRTFDCSVDGVSCGQSSLATAGTTLNQVRLVDTASLAITTDLYIDDLILSLTTGDYPIGPGKVLPFVPTADGTHTATTTTIVKGTIATPVGANVAGSTDVFNWVNGVPLLGGQSDNTRLVNQQTNGTTLYAEVIFGTAPNILTPTYPPRSVEVITADRQASTAAGDMTTKLNDNGTESTIIARVGTAGTTTDKYVTKQFATPPTGGAWTLASGNGNFSNIRARFGYSNDANPDQYWRGVMIEAEFVEWPQKILNINQSMKRASYR